MSDLPDQLDESPHIPIPVTVRGLFQGAELAGAGELWLYENGVRIEHSGSAPVWIRYSQMEGVVHRHRELALFLSVGDIIELEGSPRLAAAERLIVRRTCFMPEFTRALRAVGTAELRAAADHDRFFGPLLAARSRSEKVEDFTKRAAAFDAQALASTLVATLESFAAERFPLSAPDRRALAAELIDLAEELFGDLDRLQAAGDALRSTPEAKRFVAWRLWLDAVRRVFNAADRWWAGALPLLAEFAVPQPRRGLTWPRGGARRDGGGAAK